MILVTGGSGSGKSEYAETKAVSYSDGNDLLYVATMSTAGQEAQKRIVRHRKMRAGKGFETLESMYLDDDIEVFRNKVVLIEDLSNLLSNYMFLRDMVDGENNSDIDTRDEIQALEKKNGKIVDIIYEILSRINGICRELIIVTNEIFSDGVVYDILVTQYIKNLAILNSRLAKISQQFTEVVYGIAIDLKK